MKGFKIIIPVLFTCSVSICNAEENLVSDSTNIIQDKVSLSKHDIDAVVLQNMYVELLDVEKQIRLTHNTLVDLNFMSPSSERKIQQKLEELSDRLDKVSVQLNSITDKEIKAEVKPYKVTVKDLKQKVSKCYNMLKKKSKM